MLFPPTDIPNRATFNLPRQVLFRLRTWVPMILVILVCSNGSGQESTSANPVKRPDEKISSKQLAFFETSVRPLLSRNCYSCHGRKKQESSLRLDSLQGMLDGGDSGEAIVPGKPDESLLVEVIEREEDQMPPGKHLDPKEIAILRQWISMGAPWPAASGLPFFSEKDRQHWAFQPRRKVEAARSPDDKWSQNEIDYFVWKKFKEQKQQPLPEARRLPLLRRVYFDLVGMPPSVEEQKAFLADRDPLAYERLVDRLLADQRYGEKWARHWLDLVRYAESDGYKADDYRPNAWRYRDYVIRSFNQDKAYTEFVSEQLAGDELDPNDPENLIATGFLRHWIYEYNQRDVRTQWDTILTDITNVTGDVFLAVSMNCARCHDHKFDPISQEDYFRLKAFFSPLLPRDDIELATPEQRRTFQKKQKIWLEKTAAIRKKLEALEDPHHQRKMKPEINKFPRDIRPMMAKQIQNRSGFEVQLTDLAYRQVKRLTPSEMEKRLKGTQKEEWKRLLAELAQFDSLKPKPLPKAFTVSDVPRTPPPTFITDDNSGAPILPGVLSILDPKPMTVAPVRLDRGPTGTVEPTADSKEGFASVSPFPRESSGRRLALAKWLTSENNPLTARVIVNRIWQNHFGKGIVGSASDFGNLGEEPADPLLLDWLANRFIRDGWKFKKLHRLILLSSTYRQSASRPRLPVLAPFRPLIRRLDAEQIRDAMLFVSGEIDSKPGGPSVEYSSTRRTVYLKVIRNRRNPLLDVFDAPDNFNSTASRNVTTTPTQSLLMINGEWTLNRARAFAKRIDQEKTVQQKLVRAYELAFSRIPTVQELLLAREFVGLSNQDSSVEFDSLVDFCHVLLNSNEFIYLD